LPLFSRFSVSSDGVAVLPRHISCPHPPFIESVIVCQLLSPPVIPAFFFSWIFSVARQPLLFCSFPDLFYDGIVWNVCSYSATSGWMNCGACLGRRARSNFKPLFPSCNDNQFSQVTSHFPLLFLPTLFTRGSVSHVRQLPLLSLPTTFSPPSTPRKKI